MICLKLLNIPDIFQFYLPLILSLVSIVCSFIMLIIYLQFPRLRINSGKLVILIMLTEINLNWLTITSLFYSDEVDCIDITSQNNFIITNGQCIGLGIIFIFFVWLYLLINLFICHNLYYSIRFLNDNFPRRLKIYLSLTIFLIILILMISLIKSDVSMSFMGICGISKSGSVQLVSSIYIIIIIPFCFYVVGLVLLKLKKNINSNNKLNLDDSIKSEFQISQLEQQHERSFLKINLAYIILFLIDWFPLAILQFWKWWCLYYIECDSETKFSEVLETISLLLISGNGFFLFLVRIQEPCLKRFFKKIFEKNENKSKLKEKLLENAGNKPLDIQSINSIDSHGDPKNSENIVANRSIEFNEHRKAIIEHNQDIMQILFLLNHQFNKINNNNLITSMCSPFNNEQKLKGSNFLSNNNIESSINFNNKEINFLAESTHNESKPNNQILIKQSSDTFKQHNNLNKQLSNNVINLDEGGINRSDINSISFVEDNVPWPNHQYTKFEVELLEIKQILNLGKDENENIVIKEIFNNEENQTLTCISYCEKLFSNLRQKYFKIENLRMIISLDFIKNCMKIIEKKENIKHEFVTHDFKIIVMFISKKVKRFLLDDYLKNYHIHITENNVSFLPKILGLFSWQFASTAKSHSILILENPFAELKFYNMKNLEKNYSAEILSIFVVSPDKIKRKKVYDFSEKKIDFEVNELKINKDEKSKLLNVLYNDVKFLENVKSFDYRLCLVFFKFEDKDLMRSLQLKDSSERKRISKIRKNQYELENGIGFCSAFMKNIFNFINKKEKKRKINQSVSVLNPTNYGRFLYEKIQEL